tara:strand:- start:1279 stop:2271 length:993 start_codon:yes stop_codon:yes gene_type:complete
MSKFRFWFLVYPDISKAIGGVKQIHRVAEGLIQLGHQAYLVQESIDFHPGWFNSSVPTIDKLTWDQSILNPKSDYIVIAETFIPILKTLQPKIKKIIFNQNGAYSFGLPGNQIFKPSWLISAYSDPSVAQIWCVSHHDYDLLVHGFRIAASRVYLLVNALEVFPPLPTICSKVNSIAYMPRKNILDYSVVIELLSRQPYLDGWEFVPIKNMNHENVISTLLMSSLFLSFGHPEGFGLPVAEAFACGCSVIGFSGLGGRELFHRAKLYNACYEVEFGDWLNFVKGVSFFCDQIKSNHDDWYSRSFRLSQEIRTQYHPEKLLQSIDIALSYL